MRQHVVGTPDGGHLRVHSFSDGPGVVMVCGTNTAASAYFRAARKLSRTVPVHVYDRRGRPGSSLQPEDYSMATEIPDLRSVLEATGSNAVFGHSYGGAVALEAGLQLPVARIALYEVSGADHAALDRAPDVLMKQLKAFFVDLRSTK